LGLYVRIVTKCDKFSGKANALVKHMLSYYGNYKLNDDIERG